MFGWFQVSLAAFLAFLAPVVDITPQQLRCTIANKNLLTKDMKKLLDHGVQFQFVLDITVTGKRPGTRTVLKKSINREVFYHYQLQRYFLKQDGTPLRQFSSREECLQAARRFENITFDVDTSQYSVFEIATKIRLAENKIISQQLLMNTHDLWRGVKVNRSDIFVNLKTYRLPPEEGKGE